jgi:hypothetical protein
MFGMMAAAGSARTINSRHRRRVLAGVINAAVHDKPAKEKLSSSAKLFIPIFLW